MPLRRTLPRCDACSEVVGDTGAHESDRARFEAGFGSWRPGCQAAHASLAGQSSASADRRPGRWRDRGPDRSDSETSQSRNCTAAVWSSSDRAMASRKIVKEHRHLARALEVSLGVGRELATSLGERGAEPDAAQQNPGRGFFSGDGKPTSLVATTGNPSWWAISAMASERWWSPGSQLACSARRWRRSPKSSRSSASERLAAGTSP